MATAATMPQTATPATNKALQVVLTSPIPDLHREWLATPVKRRTLINDDANVNMLLQFFDRLMNELPEGKCFSLDHPPTLTKCTCLSDLKGVITEEERRGKQQNLCCLFQR